MRNVRALYPEVTEVRDTGFNTISAGWYVVTVEGEYIGPCKWHEAMTHAQSLGRPLNVDEGLTLYLIQSGIKDWSINDTKFLVNGKPEYIEVTVWIPVTNNEERGGLQ